ncbi:DUF58 domain-containing protein [Halorubrum ezzemoulense]|uniref:DUF58 domain-containing protein n=1 Tax=Halorubrum ezzemoulense TaxID=337243 RepID=UPI00232EC97D|nr:DUF58 domain-containing protein [Halorubrum ezzemoulense]MDB9249347.1 DUF58 domain-containing protein [Halorubrum ezzemoulense]MDB9257567.1 DUF58 domain-containing protein [Halorubrum ezzemoulense]MDB9262070.1 DUF58 domain-containing protein [Halorubrum ezzemoulense]MDB9265573.1 DUF58 domain-containing protein [Halorubrum ezzemoulense]MDB9267928.1 DUF58 domain-containing protein [Halorubrum ezzemoulense]
MNVTGRWWAIAGTGVALVALGAAADRPILLLGAAGLGAWLLGTAAAASRSMRRLVDRLAVEYDLTAATALVDATATATLTVRRPPETAAAPLAVSVDTPPGVDGEGMTVSLALDPGTTEATTTASLSFPIVGRFEFPTPTVEVGDSFGLYRTRVRLGSAPTVTVTPRTPDLHVGQGGEKIRSAYGEHQADRPGPGVTTRELRQYVPGDDVQRIDWNATARLAETYVRETEGETDRQTLLVVDHRRPMSVGPEGDRPLDYAREVGIGITRAGLDRGDPIGLWTVGGSGPTASVDPGSATQLYGRIETLLYRLTPTGDGDAREARSVVRAQTLAERLDGDASRFARTLAAYTSDADPYMTLLRDDPLVGTVERIRNRSGREGLIVLVTSDAQPTELREAVKSAIRGGGRALVFLLPGCLFEPSGLTDLDAAYERYRTFEQLRREIDGHPRVTAFEIAPNARLNTVLEHRRATREVSR